MTDVERDIVDSIASAIYAEAPRMPGKNGKRPRWVDKAAREAWNLVKARIAAEAERESSDERLIRRYQ